MMIADVQFLHAGDQFAHDVGMAMAQVEDAAVAMTVDQPRLACHVPDERTVTPAHHEIDAGGLKEVDLARRDGRAKRSVVAV
jgi:hypothetical protein